MPSSAPTVTLPTVDEEWRTYRNKVLPKGCPDTQVIECRRAFYAGAWALFNLQLRVVNLMSALRRESKRLNLSGGSSCSSTSK